MADGGDVAADGSVDGTSAGGGISEAARSAAAPIKAAGPVTVTSGNVATSAPHGTAKGRRPTGGRIGLASPTVWDPVNLAMKVGGVACPSVSSSTTANEVAFLTCRRAASMGLNGVVVGPIASIGGQAARP